MKFSGAGADAGFYKLDVGDAGFQVTYISYMNLDLTMLLRIHIDHYRIIGSRATRIAPLAEKPEGFLDEWIDLPWQEAVRWSDPSNAAALEKWHARLARSYDLQSLDKHDYGSQFEFSQPCDKPPTRWQIGVSIDSLTRVDRLPEELYFTVTRQGEALFLQRIDTVRPPGCPGKAVSPYQVP
jgi:hypothetical protein